MVFVFSSPATFFFQTAKTFVTQGNQLLTDSHILYFDWSTSINLWATSSNEWCFCTRKQSFLMHVCDTDSFTYGNGLGHSPHYLFICDIPLDSKTKHRTSKLELTLYLTYLANYTTLTLGTTFSSVICVNRHLKGSVLSLSHFWHPPQRSVPSIFLFKKRSERSDPSKKWVRRVSHAIFFTLRERLCVRSWEPIRHDSYRAITYFGLH